MKKVLIIIGIVVLLLVVAVIVLPGPIARPIAEKVATSTLKVGVTIDKLAASLFSGSVGLEGLSVKNPEGYTKEYLTQVGNIGVDAKITSFMGDTAVIEHVNVEGLTLNIESKGGSTNLNALLKNLDNGEKATEEEPAAEGEGMKFKINLITLKDIEIIFSSGVMKDVKLKVSELEIKDIGNDDTGASLKTVLNEVFKKLATKSMDLAKNLTGELGDAFKGIDLSNISEGVKDTTKDIVDKVKNPIKNIFK